MEFLIQQTLIYTVPLLIVALAGVFAERCGIINLALEGIMVFGAFAGVLFINIMQINNAFTKERGQLLLIFTLIICAVIGAIFSLLLSFAAVNLKANQTITGTALNMIAPAVVLFFSNILAKQNTYAMSTGDSASWFILKKSSFDFDNIDTLNPVAKFLFINDDGGLNFFARTFLTKNYITTYICLLTFIILSIILYKTAFGLRLRACGENPQAAASLGINVQKMRYIGTSISGALAGVGGFVFILTTANCTSSGDVAGFGFLALAVMIFGNWNPLTVAGAAFLFGLFKCIAAAYSTIDINGDGVYSLAQIGLSANFYRLLPYLVTLLVLAFTSKSSRAPKASGIPYDKSVR